jgi:hypothetical protein
MFILELSLSAILWSALGAMLAAHIMIGAIIFILCLSVLASPSGVIHAKSQETRGASAILRRAA